MRVDVVQQAMVRLMVSPAFVREVYAGGRVRGLADDELAALRAVDRRAWSTDVHRRARLLTAILEELPATVGQIGVEAADTFFDSPAFAAVLARRGSMTLGFAAWAATWDGRPTWAPLEGALALARRAWPAEGSGVCCAPGVVPLETATGAFDAWHAARAQLGPAPVAALIDGARVPPPPTAGRARYLLSPDPTVPSSTDRGSVSVEEASRPLVELLQALRRPVPRAQAVGIARRHGAGADAEAVIADLIANGTLREQA